MSTALLLRKSEKDTSYLNESSVFTILVEKILTCYVSINTGGLIPVVSCLLQKVLIFYINLSQILELKVLEDNHCKVLLLIDRILLPNSYFAEWRIILFLPFDFICFGHISIENEQVCKVILRAEDIHSMNLF